MAEDHSCCDVPDLPDARESSEEQLPAPVASAYTSHRAAPNETRKTKAPKASFRLRATAFLSIAALILGIGVWLVRPTDMAAEHADYTVDMSMAGFNPASLDLPAGKVVTVKLVNNESPFHASGALHQFAVDELGINEKLDAKQTRVITIESNKPGVYTFYCDVCCGGKRSPTMQGTLNFR
jgi:cytochrome c oxidase subunit 2